MYSTDELDDRLGAAVTQLAAASNALDRSALQAGGTRAEAIDHLWSTWASIDKADARWTGISALLILDDPHPGSKLASGSPAISALHGQIVEMLTALLNIDTAAGEVRLKHYDDLHHAHERMTVLIEQDLLGETREREAAA